MKTQLEKLEEILGLDEKDFLPKERKSTSYDYARVRKIEKDAYLAEYRLGSGSGSCVFCVRVEAYLWLVKNTDCKLLPY